MPVLGAFCAKPVALEKKTARMALQNVENLIIWYIYKLYVQYSRIMYDPISMIFSSTALALEPSAMVKVLGQAEQDQLCGVEETQHQTQGPSPWSSHWCQGLSTGGWNADVERDWTWVEWTAQTKMHLVHAVECQQQNFWTMKGWTMMYNDRKGEWYVRLRASQTHQNRETHTDMWVYFQMYNELDVGSASSAECSFRIDYEIVYSNKK